MGCWEEIDVAPTTAVSARGRTEWFVKFAVERDATVAALSCAYVYDQMVKKCLSLYGRAKGSNGEVGGLGWT